MSRTIVEVVTDSVWNEDEALRCLENDPDCFRNTYLLHRICELPFDEGRTAFLCARTPEGLYAITYATYLNDTPVMLAIKKENLELVRYFIEFDARLIRYHVNVKKDLLGHAIRSQAHSVVSYFLTEKLEEFENLGSVTMVLCMTYSMPEIVNPLLKAVIPRLGLPSYRVAKVWNILYDKFDGCAPHELCVCYARALFAQHDGWDYATTFNFNAMCEAVFKTVFLLEHERGGKHCSAAVYQIAKEYCVPYRNIIGRIGWIIEQTGGQYLHYHDTEGRNVLHVMAEYSDAESTDIARMIARAAPSLLFEQDSKLSIPASSDPVGSTIGITIGRNIQTQRIYAEPVLDEHQVRTRLLEDMCMRPREMMEKIPMYVKLNLSDPMHALLFKEAKTAHDFTWLFCVATQFYWQWAALARRYPPVYLERNARGETFLMAGCRNNNLVEVRNYVRVVQVIRPIPEFYNTNAQFVYNKLTQVPRRSRTWEKYVGESSMLSVLHHAQFIKQS